MNNLVIIGAGGFGLEVAAYAEDMAYAIKGFLDDTKPLNTQHAGYPILGPTDSKIDTNCQYIIAVGSPKSRKLLAEKFLAKGAKFLSIHHPSSYIAKTSEIGLGTIIAPFAFVGPEAVVENHCIFNIYASAGHESVIGNYSVLSPYSVVHGSGVLGKAVFLGNQACVTARIHIGDGATIAAGSVVYTQIPENVSVIGNPASFRSKN